MGWVIFEGHTRDQGDIEPNKGLYGPQNVYHGMKYLAKSCKFSPDVCTALRGSWHLHRQGGLGRLRFRQKSSALGRSASGAGLGRNLFEGEKNFRGGKKFRVETKISRALPKHLGFI